MYRHTYAQAQPPYVPSGLNGLPMVRQLLTWEGAAISMTVAFWNCVGEVGCAIDRLNGTFLQGEGTVRQVSTVFTVYRKNGQVVTSSAFLHVSKRFKAFQTGPCPPMQTDPILGKVVSRPCLPSRAHVRTHVSRGVLLNAGSAAHTVTHKRKKDIFAIFSLSSLQVFHMV